MLYRRSKQLLALLETTKDELKHMDSTFKGHIKIGATSTIGECILPAFLTKFCEHYHDIHIEIIIGNSLDISNKMKSLQLDLALIEGSSSFPAFNQKCFFNDQLVLIAPRSYLFTENTLAAHLLRKQRWITREHGSGLREAVDGFLVAHQIVPKTKLVLSSNYAIKEAVSNGLGISMIPRSLIHQVDTSNSIKVLQLNTNSKIAFSSLIPKHLPTTPITTLFLDSFVKYMNIMYKYMD